MTRQQNIRVGLCLLAGFIYRVCISVQGIDHVDAGFGTTFFQHILSSPDALTYNYLYYLTGLLGGMWNGALGGYGLMGFRVFEALLLTATVAVLAALYRRWMSSPVLLSAAIGMSFLFPTIVTTLHYNTVTYALVVCAAYCYVRGEEQHQHQARSLALMLAAGVFIGLAFFARIVNLTLLALVAVPWLLPGQTVGSRLRKSGSLLLGMVAGAGLTCGCMAALGHWPYFIEALREAGGTAGQDESSHSLVNLVLTYGYSLLKIVSQVAVMLLCVWTDKWGSLRQSVTGRMASIAAMLGFVVLVVTNPPYLPLVAVCTLLCASSLTFCASSLTFCASSLTQRTGGQRMPSVALCFLALAAYVVPFGSDVGIAGIFHWMVGLLVFPAFHALDSLSRPIRRRALQALALIACLAVFKTAQRSYGSDSARTEQTHRISERLNVLDSGQRAARCQQAIVAITHYAAGNPFLVLANHQTHLYYATGKIPFLGTTETHAYAGQALTERLDSRLQHFGGTYPVIAIIEGIGESKPETQQVLKAYMQRHCYRLACSADSIYIYIR